VGIVESITGLQATHAVQAGLPEWRLAEAFMTVDPA
jgi:hypothetical protein